MSTDDSVTTGNSALRRLITHDLVESLIRVGLLVVLIVLCLRTFAPFANLLSWALILAVALAPLHKKLMGALGGGEGRAATVMIVLGLLLLGTPTVVLGIALADHLGDVQALMHGGFTINPPKPEVAEWPIIGNKVFQLWGQAAANLPEFLQQNRDTVINISSNIISIATSAALGTLVFLAALVITGIMLAYTKEADEVFERIFIRLVDAEKGPRLRKLSIATIRSVAMGVIGVAFIQALIIGIGFVLAKIPAAGVLALIVFFVGILQLPALLITIPAIIYLWSTDYTTTHNTIFTIYLVIGGFSDQILKPMLLGRGVDAPMLVILIGALGGMIAGGLIGLFVGGVVLALGYKIFMEWVDGHLDLLGSSTDATALPQSPGDPE